MFVVSVLLAVFVVILTLLINWWLVLRKYSGLRKVPGPIPLPLIGNANEIGKTTVETHPDLPPLNQGTISKIEAQYREMGHVRKVPSKRQAVVDDDTKLNLLLAVEENPITPARLLHSFLKLQNEYGSLYKLWLGPRLHLMMSKPEYLEHLLNSNIHLAKSDGYDLFRPWLGDGLLVSRAQKRHKTIRANISHQLLVGQTISQWLYVIGAKWKSRRKMITPTFHFKILEEFMITFNKQFDVLLDILSEKVKENPGESIEICELVNLASLDIICETAFGTSIRAQHKGNVKYVEAVNGFLEIFTLRFFSEWLRNPVLFRFSSLHRKYDEYLKILHSFTNRVIKERKAEFSSGSENSGEKSRRVDDDGIKRRAALLDMLLEATFNGEHLSDEDIRAEVDTFMFETFRKKVYDELIDTFGTENRSDITLSQINELKYLDLVVKESLRYYSPVPLIERVLDNDWTIGSTNEKLLCHIVVADGITIPKDTTISIFLYGMNHNPEAFPDPERFDPERFLPEKQTSRNTYAYIPFSAGPRNCIGQKYAVSELKTAVVKILLHFEVTADPDFKPEIGMCSVLKSRNGIKIKFKLRK
ncbi:hypothetical protein NQ318_000106 [Aromia moschata]|uniref:Cytochrome P450 n=1 Tax=Aromia moschata TaxID=1265417 RepID=A0AAV8XG58_9CUCU|nr:hypothetical protein NQ318_000106 [Aromia moschata]